MPGLLALYAAATAIPVVPPGRRPGSQLPLRGPAAGSRRRTLGGVAHSADGGGADPRRSPAQPGHHPAEKADLRRLVDRAVRSQDVLRLRLRDLAGNVVFSDDGSGFKDRPEDEVFEPPTAPLWPG